MSTAAPAARAADIAIVGIGCRFPGADSPDAFWRNLRDGLESVTRFTPEELRAAGVAEELLAQPNYVPANAVMEGCELFDADFFGYSPREAEILDVQQRIFLECAWHACDDAGFAPAAGGASCGVYAGAGLNTYLLYHLAQNPEVVAAAGGFQVMISNDKDHLATRTSYKLNLRGPSITVQTACSTSLVAVHLACQALLAGECDRALAGGVSVRLPQTAGYLHQPGMILSADGHCRAFDEQADGIVGGNGAGVVVLRRLADALADGDRIRAVIRGTAVNNDGAVKVGYTAPGEDGQHAVIDEALALAEVHPDTVSYVEAHGTATPLGDLVEVAALTRAWRKQTDRRGFCALGSVKTNLGHLDTAAGIAGLIKTVLMLEHRTIAPTLHFTRANPRIDFAASPFRVAARATPWEAPAGAPLRAGVSSFGIGGTNAHAILEEAPSRPAGAPGRPRQLLVLSAATAGALAVAEQQLAARLDVAGEAELPDIAYTLAVGRRAMAHRRFVTAASPQEAAASLRIVGRTGVPGEGAGEVAFLFPGQGAQFVQMGEELYRHEPVFRRELDRCADLLRPHVGFDLREAIFPKAGVEGGERLRQTSVAQPALFGLSYALAQLWMDWGVEPVAMLGHSLGEYVAATLAGVFTLENALALVALRGGLMQGLPAGKMLAVALDADEARRCLGTELSLAALNGPRSVVLSGAAAAIDQQARELSARGVACAALETSHAFHSAMMEPILQPFADAVRAARPAEARRPFLSNVTGTWITAAEATSPDYWASHLRQPVRFADCWQTLLARRPAVVLELGPGRVLSNLVRAGGDAPVVRPALGGSGETPWKATLEAAGECWLAGVPLDWARFYSGETRRRAPLPPYPFQRQRYFVMPAKAAPPERPVTERRVLDDWFSIPTWRRVHAPLPPRAQSRAGENVPSQAEVRFPGRAGVPPGSPNLRLTSIREERLWLFDLPGGTPALPGTTSRSTAHVVTPSQVRSGHWLVLADALGVGMALAAELRGRGCQVSVVEPGSAFSQSGPRAYRVDPAEPAHFTQLLAALDEKPVGIIHLWNTTGAELATTAAMERGFHSLLWLSQALAQSDGHPLDWLVVADGLFQVAGEALSPGKATLLGPVRVLPKEFPGTRCRCVDPGSIDDGLVARLIEELAFAGEEPLAAYRGSGRWVPALEPAPLPEPARTALRERGVYLITGGLGGLGRTFAGHLAQEYRARLVLITRSVLPPRNAWAAHLASGAEDRTAQQMRDVLAWEKAGAECLVLAADVASEAQMAAALTTARERFGALHGVIHAAGVAGGGLMQLKQRRVAEEVFAPKVAGTLVLDRLLAHEPLDFFALTSSISSLLGEFGQVDYCAANAFLDAFAQARGGRTVSVNWDTWEEVGMAARATTPGMAAQSGPRPRIRPQEGWDAFQRVLASGLNHVLVAPFSFAAYLAPETVAPVHAAAPSHPRPAHLAGYAAPETEMQELIASLFEEAIGIRPIGLHDDFFALGGHSLTATQITGRFYEKKGVKLTLSGFFEDPTVAGVARHAEARQLELLNSAELERLVAEVEALSADEVRRQLEGANLGA